MMQPADVVNILLDEQQPYRNKETAIRHFVCATTVGDTINYFQYGLQPLMDTIPPCDTARHAALAFVITEIVYLQHRPREERIQ